MFQHGTEFYVQNDAFSSSCDLLSACGKSTRLSPGIFHVRCLKFQYRLLLRARLHRALESVVRQLCDDASDSVLIGNNGAT